ncbi:MAG: DUF1549 domain-containing protein [bacterium]|nr:DUF1549 domain-containing protein [bacterium]
MQVSRRAFLGSAAAMALFRDGFAAPGGDMKVFAPNGGQAADFLICRRLYLDICGRIPTPEEVGEYTASRDVKKREKLVERLLETDDYADYWAMRYCDVLRVKSEFPINLWPNAVYVYHRRIRDAIRNDEPWNDFARALLFARGSNFRVPEVNFLRATAEKTPEGISEAVTSALLLDPTDKYARYFSRVGFKSTREWKEVIVYLKPGPEDATPNAFMSLLEGPLAEKFVQTPVQRVHWWVYGTLAKGGALDRWVSVFRNGGYRLKPLLRHVFNQPDYRRGPGKGGFPARRLDAEVLDDAICSLTGAVRDFNSIAPEPYSFLPPTRKAVLIEDGSISSAFLLLFGRPARDSGLLEERNNTITAKQRLYLYNSSKLWRDLGAMVARPSFKGLSHKDQIEDLYMRFLSRPPVKDELFYLDQKNSINARDVAWYILNSREFLYRI